MSGAATSDGIAVAAAGSGAASPARPGGAARERASSAPSASVTPAPVLWMLPAITVQALLASVAEPAWLTVDAPVLLSGAALLLIVGGGWTMRAAAAELEVHATPVCVDEPARALITTGPYRHSRHPMYVGSVAVLAGAACALGSPLAAGVALAYGAWIDRRHARHEDAALHERFGPAWRAYAARVRRWR